MSAPSPGPAPERIPVEIEPGESVTALAYKAAAAAGVTLILAHGAGGNQTSPFMTGIAAALADRGIDTVTFNFAYSEQRRRLPDRNDRLEDCYRAVIRTVGADARLGETRSSRTTAGRSRK
jgi:predicted alpha/beta-hydrolase family hydrolase